jgi:Tfp pilus assembly protein PilV
MQVRFGKAGNKNLRITCAAMTLVEILIAIVVLVAVMGGIIMGYVQANRMAEFSSQSLAATSYALQGMERMRAAQWNAEMTFTTNGPGTSDVLPLRLQADGTFSYSTNEIDVMDVPSTGAQIPVTNYITVTQIYTNPSLRQVVSRVVWIFPLTGKSYTNTIVTLRAPDQFQ